MLIRETDLCSCEKPNIGEQSCGEKSALKIWCLLFLMTYATKLLKQMREGIIIIKFIQKNLEYNCSFFLRLVALISKTKMPSNNIGQLAFEKNCLD